MSLEFTYKKIDIVQEWKFRKLTRLFKSLKDIVLYVGYANFLLTRIFKSLEDIVSYVGYANLLPT